MFSFMKFAVAGVIVLAFGGFLLSAGLLGPQDTAPIPAAGTAAPSASAKPTASTTETPTKEADPVPETTLPDDALVMGTGNGGEVAGWSEIGRLDTIADDGIKHGEMQHLQAIGDRLVAIGTTIQPNEGPIQDVLYQSVDGLDWVPAVVPGNEPKIADLAAAANGLIAAGSDRVNGARVARI